MYMRKKNGIFFMFQIFQFGSQSTTNATALVSSDTPSGIARACMEHILANTLKNDTELLDSIQVCGLSVCRDFFLSLSLILCQMLRPMSI